MTDSTVAALSFLAKVGADFRQFDEDEIAELLDGVGGDADGRDVALDLQPLVFFGKFQHDRSLRKMFQRL